jgi:Alternative complex III, ActD subunit
MAHAAASQELHGLLAEFDSAQQLLDAAGQVRAAGYTRTDAFSPFPIHGLAEALGFHDRRISLFVLLGGIAGAAFGYGLEYWTQAIAYPLNIGGRPYFSWVSFIPPAFETTILFAAFTAGLTMLALNGLPQPYHPVFNAPRFSLASQDKFFLVIEAKDPRFSLEQTGSFLAGLHAREVVAIDE